jgi:DNA-binding response OmpR family regulator
MAYKIIVADGSPSVQRVVQLAFTEPDFEVHAFEDGLEALQAIGQINPDAVLLGISLEKKDGYEVGRYLRSREDFKKTALVLLKNAFEPLDQEKLRGLACDEICQKPFDSEKLARTVREIIDRKKGPHSFPEESLLEENPSLTVIPLFKEPEFVPPPVSSSPERDIDDKIRRQLQEEVLSVERELEKRLKASLRAEMLELLEKAEKKNP